MFKGCTGLTSCTINDATDLDQQGCVNAFNGCTNLSYVKAMFTGSNFGSGYTNNWLQGVASTGTYVMNGNATYDTSTRGVSTVPEGWTIETALN